MTSRSFTIPVSSKSGFSSSDTDGDWAYIAVDDGYGEKAEYGGYYSWHVATAGTGTKSMSSGDATSSICPKGWKLPKGGSRGDFQTLYNQYNTLAKMRTDADGPEFLLSGFYGSSTAYSREIFGYYWSRTAYSTDRAYFLSLTRSSVNPAYDAPKHNGISVRCVAEQ